MQHRTLPKVLLTFLLLASLLVGTGALRVQDDVGAFARGEYVPGEVLVKFRPGVTLEAGGRGVRADARSLDAVMRQYHVTAAQPLFANAQPSAFGLERIYKLNLPAKADVLAAVADFSFDANVEYAEPNYIHRIMPTTPNDPRFSEEWGLHNTGQTGGTPDADVDGPEAWDITTGSSSLLIAVVDTGVDYNHEDLNDGRVRTDIDYDFVNNDDDAMDDHSHGTHVAGTIAAETNNGVGVAGVMWQAQILPVKVCSALGFCTSNAIAQGISHAADHGAAVINMSLGGTCAQIIADAVNYAYFDQGVVIVAAAGNENSGVSYPAKHDPVIAVAATDHNDARASFSNYGPEIDVAAPGVGILSTVPGNGYASFSGTSMASPHTAGVAGLILANRPALSQGQLREVLRQSADDLGAPGFDNYFGHGRISAFQALQTATPAEPPAPPLAECPSCVVRASTVGMSSRLEVMKVLWRAQTQVFEHTPAGQEFVDLFFDISPQVSLLVFRDAALRSQTQTVLADLLPIFRALVGEGKDVVITAEQVSRVDRWVNAIAAQASPEVSSQLLGYWQELPPKRFVNMTATEAWQAMQ